MAGEIQIAHGVTGRTLYAVVRTAAGNVWNGSAFVAYNGANWTTYAVALSEQGTSGYYVGNFPTTVDGIYNVEIRDRLGGSPATTDTVVGAGDVEWIDNTIGVVGKLADIHADGETNKTVLSRFVFGPVSNLPLVEMMYYMDANTSLPRALTGSATTSFDTLNKLDTAMVLDGSVYQFTANALELAPSSGGGGTDWTEDERTAIRAIMGIPASGSVPVAPVVGILDTIADGVVAMPASVWTHSSRTLTSVAPVPPPPAPFSSADMAANIKQAIQQTMVSILVATASPKPTYSIEGQSVSYSDFIKSLIDTVSQLNTLLLTFEPFELKSVMDQ